ncbi:MAG: DUF6092 family protein [Fervidicoccaceae archaeon]
MKWFTMRGSAESREYEYIKLLSFLITSARGLVDEPQLYGPLRLIDAAARLISLMRSEGMDVSKLERLEKMIEENEDLVMIDKGKFIEFLDELVLELTSIIKEL